MIGIIGAGNMGKAIAVGIDKKVAITDIVLSKLRGIKNKRIKIEKDNISLARHSGIIILAVKPKEVRPVLADISPYIKGKLIISIAAGIETVFIERLAGRGAKVIRVMPNMPALIGKGVSAISAGRFAGRKDLALARGIFLKLGEVVEVKESMMDAVTAVSGSGPAYYFLFTDILAKAAIKAGLEEKLAEKLAMATFMGAAEAAGFAGLSMREFIERVASKGGTTEAALAVFKNKDLSKIVERAVIAARDRSRCLRQ